MDANHVERRSSQAQPDMADYQSLPARTARTIKAFTLLGALVSILCNHPAWASQSDHARGKLLYENQCTGCHESLVHIRENHRVTTLTGVQEQARRWAAEIGLRWSSAEYGDVARYLFDRYYTNSATRGSPKMNLTSTAFSQNSEIPVAHTCDGEDQSPALFWSDTPAGTKSLVLIVDDPDAPDPAAPKMTWVHWVLYNIPPDAAGLSAAVASGNLPAGTLEGLNDWMRTGYGGPCPPIGRHRYFHKLYALDTLLPDLKTPTKLEVEQAMQGHVLDKAELIGTYQKQ